VKILAAFVVGALVAVAATVLVLAHVARSFGP
jgi:hypothetical protein